MPIGPHDIVEVDILAVASGQTVNNTLHYRADGDVVNLALNTWLAEFQSEWQAAFIPALHSSYEIQAYVARIISGMIWLSPDPVESPSRPVFRYREQSILQGDPVLDKGDLITDALPTFVVVSAEKVCGQVESFANPPAPLSNEKIVRGGIRFSPIVEAQTEPAEPNALTAAAIAAFGAGLELVKQIAVGADGTKMVVLSEYKDNVHRRTLPPAPGLEPSFAVARVNSFLVNPFASSQVSRKQRARGGQ